MMNMIMVVMATLYFVYTLSLVVDNSANQDSYLEIQLVFEDEKYKLAHKLGRYLQWQEGVSKCAYHAYLISLELLVKEKVQGCLKI